MEQNSKTSWNQKPINVILLLIFFFPLGLYFMWKNKMWSNLSRVIITILIVVFTIGIMGNKEGNIDKGNLGDDGNMQTDSPLVSSPNGTYYYDSQEYTINLGVNGSTFRGTLKLNAFSDENLYLNGFIKNGKLYYTKNDLLSGFNSCGSINKRGIHIITKYGGFNLKKQ